MSVCGARGKEKMVCVTEEKEKSRKQGGLERQALRKALYVPVLKRENMMRRRHVAAV